MIRSVSLIVVGTVLICGVATAADEDPVEKKLTDAKAEYEKAAENARSGLLADLKKKEKAAQKAGDFKTLEKVQAETKAFEDSGELPKSVPVRRYEGQLRTARALQEEAYGVAVKEYTKDGKIALAKAVHQELDEFKKGGIAAGAAGPFQTESVWVSDTPKRVLTVTERRGETFRARFAIGEDVDREVTGTIKGNRLSWYAKDVRVVKGDNPGGDNHGTIIIDKNEGFRIDFVHGLGKVSGTYSLRLKAEKK